MRSGPKGLAVTLGIVFVTTFVALLWLVRRIFVARGWHELGTAAHPVRVRSRAASRLIGAGFALAGCGFVVWSWNGARAGRLFSFKMAASGPAFLGMGAYLVIEAPVAPADGEPFPGPSLLGWVLTFSGLAVGLLYAEFLRTGRVPFAH